MTINERINSLRSLMIEKNLDAYIIPSTDPHISEYVTPKWQSRSWISGFTGSAGTIVITRDHAGLWTDGRYFLQASEQLSGSEINLHKLGMSGVKDYPDWLASTLPKNSKVGFDSWVFPLNIAQKLKEKFALKGIKINGDHDLIAPIWENRPELPTKEFFDQPIKYAGKSRKEKIDEIREGLKNKGATHTLICTLDDIGWALNIRGYDVDYNPVVISYLLITPDSASLFIDNQKIPSELKSEFENDGITFKTYHDILESIKLCDNDSIFLIDPARTNYKLYDEINRDHIVVLAQNISTDLKARKNEIEISGMRSAMERDCAGLVEFVYWLENSFGSEEIDELKAMEKLRECRSKQDLFYGESFNTIAGYAGNGAIIHYSANESTNKVIGSDNFFLLDSGGQYFDGTTDITRIFHLGNPSEEEKSDYTLVLKGMIQLTLQKFPENTRGSQLDILARQYLWNEEKNYQHGTGHGVGCFMNVHEGPQNIRTEENPTTLKTGMILSNEPGIYRANKHGVRLENLILVKDYKKSDFGKFLEFETLTLFPFEKKCINKDLLTDLEVNWLNDYHQMVYDRCSELLDDNKREWLKYKCSAL